MTVGNRHDLFAQGINVSVALRTQLGPKSDIPPRAPAAPRLPPKLPPRPRGAPRKDILLLTMLFRVKTLFYISLSVPGTAKPLVYFGNQRTEYSVLSLDHNFQCLRRM